MNQLDRIVQKSVESYRVVYLISSLLALGCSISKSHWGSVAALVVILPITYFIGLHILGYALSKLVDKSVLVADIQQRRIAEINRRLDAGELQAGTQELEDEMKKAGLRPLAIITQKGPVFASQFGADLHEWIHAKEGLSGDVQVYTYVGHAVMSEDGAVELHDADHEKDHLVLDGFLYEHVPEPKNEVVQQP